MSNNSLKYSNQIEKIKQILKRNFDDTCVKCGSEIEEIDNPELTPEQLERYKKAKLMHTTFKCIKCGFVYCSAWRHEYINAIESIVKKSFPYKLKLDFSKCMTGELQGDYKDSTDKFLQIQEKDNSLILRFSKDQWFFLAGMFIDALSEEEKKGIAEMHLEGVMLT